MGTASNAALREPWNEGRIIGQEGSVQAQGHLGPSSPSSDGEPDAGARPFQLGHQPQASRGGLVAVKCATSATATKSPRVL